MSGNFNLNVWGQGVMSASDGRGSGVDQTITDQMTEDDYRGLSITEGLATVTGDLATDKPELQTHDFPGPVAEAAYYDDSLVVGLQGCVGSGKTTTVFKSRLRRAVCMPRSVIDGIRYYKVLIIRATYRQLWSTTIPDFLAVFPKDLGDWSGGKGGPVTFVMQFEDQFGIINFIAEFMAFGDDIVAAMRGYKATDILLHEMDTNPREILGNAITRIKRYPDQKHFEGYPAELSSYGQIIGDFNAPEEDNYCFNFFHNEDARREILIRLNKSLPDGAPPIEVNFYNQPGYGQEGCENLQNLPVGYYDGQIATLTIDGRGDLIKRLVYNQTTYLRVGQPVFEREFNRNIHVSPDTLEPIAGIPITLGLDQGFIGAAIIGQKISMGRAGTQFRVLGEMMFPKERLLARVFGQRLADLIDQRWPNTPIECAWGDIAGEQGSSLTDEENRTWNLLVGRVAGFSVRPQRVGANRISPRLEAVRSPLELITGGKPHLIIDPSCKFLIAGFEARYVWEDKIDKSGDKRKIPNKSLVEANVMDALQYWCLSESKPDGTTRNAPPNHTTSGRIGHNGGPPMSGQGGLTTAHDVLNPYGD